jgi:acyl-CoA-dependent ceramide synthase
MQLAFWFQQLYVLHIEERRKDHIAMISHHIITIALVWSSYYTNLTRVGNAVLCCMDISDIFLSVCIPVFMLKKRQFIDLNNFLQLAKILKYLGFTNICNVSFGLFAVSWPITRHFFFSIVTWSVASKLIVFESQSKTKILTVSICI